MAKRTQPVAGKDIEVVHKPRPRKPKDAPPLAMSAYLATVMTETSPAEAAPQPAALNGDVFPPLPEGRIP